MPPESIAQYIQTSFEDVFVTEAWGETSFFYNPNRALPRGVYFATLKERDGANDRRSLLDRPGVFRLSVGVSPATYLALFGPRPPRPAAGGVVETGHDFAQVNVLAPHPVYAWMSWVSVLSPTEEAFERVKPLLCEAHAAAQRKFSARLADRGRP
jgi:hypothetical protein